MAQGKWPKRFPVRENTGKLCQNTRKTQGILFAQVVNSLVPKVKDIAIFAAKISNFFQKLARSARQFCVCNSYKFWENLRLDRENAGNLK